MVSYTLTIYDYFSTENFTIQRPGRYLRNKNLWEIFNRNISYWIDVTEMISYVLF